jgi:hypothetical protein
MDTSTEIVAADQVEDQQVNEVDEEILAETAVDTTAGKRKRVTKKVEETPISNGRPKRTLSKRRYDDLT